MQDMQHTLRHRLGHPVETTRELLGGKWKPDLLAALKERLLQYAEHRNGGSTSTREDSPRPSAERGHLMQLYVVRHGTSVESGENIPDEWRPLTDKGRRRFQRTARAFAKLGRNLDLILTSPLVRAVQTAEILAGETDPGEVAVLAELDPRFDFEAVRNAIAARAGKAEAVAIVGHEPQLSSVLATLAGVTPEDIDLENGTIVRVDLSTLTDGASADPRWWLKQKGTRKKGLPLRKQAEESRPGTGAESRQSKRVSKKGRRRGRHASSISDTPVDPPDDVEKADASSPSTQR
jgi:phosphohistidine phosphatase